MSDTFLHNYLSYFVCFLGLATKPNKEFKD